MGIWTPNTPGSLSDILTGDDAQDEAMRSFEHGSTEPATKVPGLLWSCTNSSVLTGLGLSTHALLRWNGSAWQKFLPGFGGVLPFVAGGFMDLGGAVPSNLGAPSSANHAARNGDVLKKDGSVALTGEVAGRYPNQRGRHGCADGDGGDGRHPLLHAEGRHLHRRAPELGQHARRGTAADAHAQRRVRHHTRRWAAGHQDHAMRRERRVAAELHRVPRRAEHRR